MNFKLLSSASQIPAISQQMTTAFHTRTQLNGSNGEFTNTDDLDVQCCICACTLQTPNPRTNHYCIFRTNCDHTHDQYLCNTCAADWYLMCVLQGTIRLNQFRCPHCRQITPTRCSYMIRFMTRPQIAIPAFLAELLRFRQILDQDAGRPHGQRHLGQPAHLAATRAHQDLCVLLQNNARMVHFQHPRAVPAPPPPNANPYRHPAGGILPFGPLPPNNAPNPPPLPAPPVAPPVNALPVGNPGVNAPPLALNPPPVVNPPNQQPDPQQANVINPLHQPMFPPLVVNNPPPILQNPVVGVNPPPVVPAVMAAPGAPIMPGPPNVPVAVPLGPPGGAPPGGPIPDDFLLLGRTVIYSLHNVCEQFPWNLSLYSHVVILLSVILFLTGKGYYALPLMLVMCEITKEKIFFVLKIVLVGMMSILLTSHPIVHHDAVLSFDDTLLRYRYVFAQIVGVYLFLTANYTFSLTCAGIIISSYLMPLLRRRSSQNQGVFQNFEIDFIGYPVWLPSVHIEYVGNFPVPNFHFDHFPPQVKDCLVYTGYMEVEIYRTLFERAILNRYSNVVTSDLLRYISGDVVHIIQTENLSLHLFSPITLARTQIAVYQYVLTMRQMEEYFSVSQVRSVRDINW